MIHGVRLLVVVISNIAKYNTFIWFECMWSYFSANKFMSDKEILRCIPAEVKLRNSLNRIELAF